MGKLSISLDPDEGIILLFVPNETEFEHYHIHLPTDGATELALALRGFLAGSNELDCYDIPIGEIV